MISDQLCFFFFTAIQAQLLKSSLIDDVAYLKLNVPLIWQLSLDEKFTPISFVQVWSLFFNWFFTQLFCFSWVWLFLKWHSSWLDCLTD